MLIWDCCDAEAGDGNFDAVVARCEYQVANGGFCKK
jgi:hypothetical protein